MTIKPTPFTLRIPDADIADLRDRLARSRFPDQAPGEPWAYGTDVSYLRKLTEYWRNDFDWRAEEAALNGFPQFRVPLDGVDLHYLHVPGVGPDPMPLLLLHGWPGSVFEFLDIIPRLTDPARFGGDAADAFTVVAPSPCRDMVCRSSPGRSGSASPKWRTVSPPSCMTFSALPASARKAAIGEPRSPAGSAMPMPTG
jgi:hypothetical protein